MKLKWELGPYVSDQLFHNDHLSNTFNKLKKHILKIRNMWGS